MNRAKIGGLGILLLAILLTAAACGYMSPKKFWSVFDQKHQITSGELTASQMAGVWYYQMKMNGEYLGDGEMVFDGQGKLIKRTWSECSNKVMEIGEQGLRYGASGIMGHVDLRCERSNDFAQHTYFLKQVGNKLFKGSVAVAYPNGSEKTYQMGLMEKKNK